MKLPIGKNPKGKATGGTLPLGNISNVVAGMRKAAPKTNRASGVRRKIPVNKATLAIGSGVTIFAIGFAMQNFGAQPSDAAPRIAEGTVPIQANSLAGLPSGIDVQAVTPTSAAYLPQDAEAPALPQGKIVAPLLQADESAGGTEYALLEDAATPMPLQSASPIDFSPVPASFVDHGTKPDTATSAPVPACDIGLTADPAPAAMVDLMVDASCMADERFTLHHNGMMFHALTDASGRSSLRVPALAENAVFIASFKSGDGAMAQSEVPAMAFYDRVVVQWRGDSGLGLHALEFDATYFADGHIHAGDPGDMSDGGSGSMGFLSRHGHDTGAEALMAEVYTFPSQISESGGHISLSVEAEVTEANCGKEIEAQTLQLKPGQPLRTNDVTLYMPACDASGDFLVLNNLLEDLKVAAN